MSSGLLGRLGRWRAVNRSAGRPLGLTSGETPSSHADSWKAKIAGAFPGYGAVALTIVWAAHDGGYDADTWYWGALIALSLLVCVVIRGRPEAAGPSRATRVAMIAFATYVIWSYASVAWAGAPGTALEGSNRALLYLLVFGVFALSPCPPSRTRALLLTWALGVGMVGVVTVLDIASRPGALFAYGRLVSPTGYFNATAALFTAGALLSVTLAVRRELPSLLRGVLLTLACGELQLALLAQSRGWLFTLPLVLVGALVVVGDRLRLGIAALVPLAGTLIALHRLLAVAHHQGTSVVLAPGSVHAAERAARTTILVCLGALLVGTLLASADRRAPARPMATTLRRTLGVLAIAVTLALGIGAAEVGTHGSPFRFVARQWDGFTHPEKVTGGSHFSAVGSGRYDFWRVSLDALRAHPINGLGQDNFDDYYVVRRHTPEEPAWTHSLEMRLLAHTGIIGFLLFLGFLGTASAAVWRARRGGQRSSEAALAGMAVLPVLVWLIHGSIDWFWEIPALTGPALGFLGLAGTLAPSGAPFLRRALRSSGPMWLAAGLICASATLVLGFSYLSVRETSRAAAEQTRNPVQALADLNTASKLNPLSASPDRLAGAIALRNGLPNIARERFARVARRDPGGWFGWFGAGLAESALGDVRAARSDLLHAARINSRQPGVTEALARVGTDRPLTPADGLRLLILAR